MFHKYARTSLNTHKQASAEHLPNAGHWEPRKNTAQSPAKREKLTLQRRDRQVNRQFQNSALQIAALTDSVEARENTETYIMSETITKIFSVFKSLL